MCTTFLPKRGGNFIPGLFTCENTTFTQSYPNGKPLKTSGLREFFTKSGPLRRLLRIFSINIFIKPQIVQKGSYTHYENHLLQIKSVKKCKYRTQSSSIKTTMPILECILMDATTNQIKFTTNDMELGIETIVEGTIEEKGKVALDAKIFYEIIRRLPDNDVTIKTDDKYAATITCEKAKFNIPGKSGEDFAYLPMIEKDEPLTISQYTLKEMIRQTIFSIAVNENNKLMTGELFEIKNNCLKVVSLDGHRISIRKMPLKKDYSDRKVVVPGKTLSEVSKILSGEVDDQVSIYFTKNHILFEFDQTMVVSRLIEGEYFRIDQMLSSDYETKLKINKKEFLDCIDRATLLVREVDKNRSSSTSQTMIWSCALILQWVP